jgi:hypothetical protein
MIHEDGCADCGGSFGDFKFTVVLPDLGMISLCDGCIGAYVSDKCMEKFNCDEIQFVITVTKTGKPDISEAETALNNAIQNEMEKSHDSSD